MYKKTVLPIQLKKIYRLFKTLSLILLLSAFRKNIDDDLSFQPITQIPQKVALLLPFQEAWKTVSESIQIGFQAANSAANKPLLIDIINTEKYHSIRASYDHAIRRGAHLIIGPLLKEDVQSLAHSPALTLPVLTLNYLNPQKEAPANFYQFGLSPLHEAQKITQHAKIQKHQSALILVPNNSWGEELAQSFVYHWEQTGQKVAGILKYSNTTSTLNHQIRHFLEFTSPNQRREDFDVIFLGATPAMGQQIKPFLDFYILSHVPVYATATIYDANIPLHLNRDLDGIVISDTSWSIGIRNIHPNIYRRCISQSESHFEKNARYYALGVDAFLLSVNLLALDQDEKKTLLGASGELYLNQDRHVIRRPFLAQLKKGIPKPLVS